MIFRTALLGLLLVSPTAMAGKKKPKGPPPPPPDPMLPVDQALFDTTFEEVDLDGEFWVPLAQWERGGKQALLAVPVERVDDVLHTGPAIIALHNDGRVNSAPFIGMMQVGGLLAGRDYEERPRHAGVLPDLAGEQIRQSFEQYANGARAGSVYATTKALQALGRVFTLDYFGQTGQGVSLLERSVKNEIIIKSDRDPSEIRKHVVVIVAEERQVWLMSEVSEDAWVVSKKK